VEVISSAPAGNGAVLPAAEAAINVLPQQAQLLSQQLQEAATEVRAAQIIDFPVQLGLLASSSTSSTVTTASSTATPVATPQAFLQTLPAEAQAAYLAMQQRHQVTQQAIMAAPEQKAAFAGQMLQMAASSAPTAVPQNASVANEVVLAAAASGEDAAPQQQATYLAALPREQQAALQSMAQHHQALVNVWQMASAQTAMAPAVLATAPASAAAARSVVNSMTGEGSGRAEATLPTGPPASSN